MNAITTIYVYLLDEAVDCWRPVKAESLGDDLYKVVDTVRETEVWQFQPGEIVRCRKQTLVDGITPKTEIVAFERVLKQ